MMKVGSQGRLPGRFFEDHELQRSQSHAFLDFGLHGGEFLLEPGVVVQLLEGVLRMVLANGLDHRQAIKRFGEIERSSLILEYFGAKRFARRVARHKPSTKSMSFRYSVYAS